MPRLLVVLLLPRRPEQWLEQDDERMITRYAAYYVCLAGMGDAAQKGKVPVEFPARTFFPCPRFVGSWSKRHAG